ncbi:PD40 domain-containing protein (plasmid) [Rhizobium ruizarguesonis]|uniref:Uncharacterized protein n=2 Tax=Rhizobium TaxID=379 RepID=A0A179B9Z4_RHILE|nr:PD40 domain-containing protein [Rhizobium leguminosarum]OAP88537.1 hypothetical protein A4U53_34710 [Rhizobium leguminosarum]
MKARHDDTDHSLFERWRRSRQWQLGVAGSGSISPDGTKAVFTSSASNLVAGDGDGHSDIFLKNLVSGAVTIRSDAAGAGNASFTPDGSKVTFVSAANNLAVLA